MFQLCDQTSASQAAIFFPGTRLPTRCIWLHNPDGLELLAGCSDHNAGPLYRNRPIPFLTPMQSLIAHASSSRARILTIDAALRATSSVMDLGSAATTPHSFEPVREKFFGQPEAVIRIKRTFNGRARRHHRKAALGAVVPAIF